MVDVGADPLSFFAGDASSGSESEGEEDKNNGVVPLNDRSYYTSNNQVRLHHCCSRNYFMISTCSRMSYQANYLLQTLSSQL